MRIAAFFAQKKSRRKSTIGISMPSDLTMDDDSKLGEKNVHDANSLSHGLTNSTSSDFCSETFYEESIILQDTIEGTISYSKTFNSGSASDKSGLQDTTVGTLSHLNQLTLESSCDESDLQNTIEVTLVYSDESSAEPYSEESALQYTAGDALTYESMLSIDDGTATTFGNFLNIGTSTNDSDSLCGISKEEEEVSFEVLIQELRELLSSTNQCLQNDFTVSTSTSSHESTSDEGSQLTTDHSKDVSFCNKRLIQDGVKARNNPISKVNKTQSLDELSFLTGASSHDSRTSLCASATKTDAVPSKSNSVSVDLSKKTSILYRVMRSFQGKSAKPSVTTRNMTTENDINDEKIVSFVEDSQYIDAKTNDDRNFSTIESGKEIDCISDESKLGKEPSLNQKSLPIEKITHDKVIIVETTKCWNNSNPLAVVKNFGGTSDTSSNEDKNWVAKDDIVDPTVQEGNDLDCLCHERTANEKDQSFDHNQLPSITSNSAIDLKTCQCQGHTFNEPLSGIMKDATYEVVEVILKEPNRHRNGDIKIRDKSGVKDCDIIRQVVVQAIEPTLSVDAQIETIFESQANDKATDRDKMKKYEDQLFSRHDPIATKSKMAKLAKPFFSSYKSLTRYRTEKVVGKPKIDKKHRNPLSRHHESVSMQLK